MYTEILQQLDLAKNEAKIYETLLREGELSVSRISDLAQIHRRNVYDSLSRLMEKGLVIEILALKENHYQAVDPEKLKEVLDEKYQSFHKIFPELKKLHAATPKKEAVHIARGVEGWKNYMRDILEVGKDVYTIGANGAWDSPLLQPYAKQVFSQAKKKGIHFYLLFNAEAKDLPFVKKYPKSNYRFLLPEYSANAAIDIFGDHIIILSGLKKGAFNEQSTFTVIVNQQIADAYRKWFQLMWDACLPVKNK